MKKKIIYLLTVVVLFISSSCNNDFLEENKKQVDGYHLDTPLFVQPVSAYTEASVTLPDLKNKGFRILQYPKIIHFETFDGHIDESGKLSFRIKVDAYDNPVQLEPQNLGSIFLNVEEFGLLSINVQSINWGTPKASVRETLVDFDLFRDRKELRIENFADGILFYKLTKKPSWLEVSKSSWDGDNIKTGDVNYLEPNRYYTLFLIPDADELSPGVHEGEIVFETSDPEHPLLKINVKIRERTYENPETMIPIEGEVVDAEFDKTTNTAVFITRNPAKLVAFNADTSTKKEKLLDKNPYCVGLSAESNTILLGESGQMKFIDLSTFTVKEKVVLPYIVADIVDGENGHYYYSNKEGEIYSFNLSSKEVKKQSIADSFGYGIKADILLKVGNKSQLALTGSFVSPNGFYLIDAAVPDDLKLVHYWHESFGKKLLTSEDFKYLFSFTSSIYKFPDENTGNTIHLLGELSLQSHTGITWMHHSALTSSVWISYSPYDPSQSWFKEVIAEYDDKTFDLKRTIALNEYVATYNGTKDYYHTSARYFFSTKAGNKLFLIKNIDVASPPADTWHIEIIDV